MRVVPVHSLPGRVRFRAAPGTLTGAGAGAAALLKNLEGLSGVIAAAVNPRTGSMLVRYDHRLVSEAAIGQVIRETGVPDTAPGPEPGIKPRETIAWSWIGWQVCRLLVPPAWKPLVTLAGALPFFLLGIKSLCRGHLDVPVLDAAALGAALAQHNVKAASTLVMLLKTGEYLEAWARERSRENLAAALSLKTGRVWIRAADNTEREIAYEAVRQGDRIILRAGALIPVDGRVLEGRALVNEAALTGEPLPVEKTSGGLLHAGTVVAEGELLAEV